MKKGFTLLEVLVAVGLFGLAVLVIVHSRGNSLKEVATSERLSVALQLLQSKMTEMEMKYQKQLDANGLAAALGKEEGKFEVPFDKYAFKVELKEAGMELTPDVLKKMLMDYGGLEEAEALEQVEKQKLVLVNLNKSIKENYAELRVQVEWNQFGRLVKVPLVTHLIPAKPKIQIQLSE